MTLVTMPATPSPRSVTWRLDQPSFAIRSGWTGRRSVIVRDAGAKWTASVQMPPIVKEANILAWRAFLAKLRGRANFFQLAASEGPQLTGVFPLVAGGGQSGTSLVTNNWAAPGLRLKAGQFVTIALATPQLVQLTDDVVADGSQVATINFLPALRASPANNAQIEVGSPYATMGLSEGGAGWSVEPGPIYSVALDCEEVW